MTKVGCKHNINCNTLISNDITSISDSEMRCTIVDGIKYPWLDKMKGQNISMIDGRVYIDGYELTKKGWKRTLRALWHKYFDCFC